MKPEIYWFNTIDSTQRLLVENIKNHCWQPPCCVISDQQSEGRGSRGRQWESVPGDLLFSIALGREHFPDDLPLHSASIYFAYFMQQALRDAKIETVLKWPNDIYLEGQKIGGVITQLVLDILICGIGINLSDNRHKHASIPLKIGLLELLLDFCEKLRKKEKWKDIFRKLELDFYSQLNSGIYSQIFQTSDEIRLLEDGSITQNGRRVYSLR